jgi:hypothetical protein
MIARAVARPAIEPLDGRRAAVAGANREAAYLDLDGFVVVLTARGRPVLPNGVVVDALPAPGTRVEVRIDGAEVWDPTLHIAATPDRPSDGGPIPLLGRAVAERDPVLAAAAGRQLIGRGPGLTPEGDDAVAATAAVVAAGPWPEAERQPWLRALLSDDLRARTTSLSATLLELAAARQVAEPLQALLAGRPGARARLQRLGHSTGRAYAAAALAATSTGVRKYVRSPVVAGGDRRPPESCVPANAGTSLRAP